jgi:hypothetical protein
MTGADPPAVQNVIRICWVMIHTENGNENKNEDRCTTTHNSFHNNNSSIQRTRCRISPHLCPSAAMNAENRRLPVEATTVGDYVATTQ